MTDKKKQDGAGTGLPGTAPTTDAGTLAGVGDSAFAAEAAALGDVTGSLADAGGTISGATIPAEDGSGSAGERGIKASGNK